MSMIDETRELLRDRKETLEVIARKANVGLSWLQKFSSNQLRNPVYKSVENLYLYLKKRKK